MTIKDGMRPVHPGEILRDTVLPALSVSVTEFARRLGVSRSTVHRVLKEDIAVSPEMALRLGRFLGNGADIWIRLQADYDLRKLELDRNIRRELDAIQPIQYAAL